MLKIKKSDFNLLVRIYNNIHFIPPSQTRQYLGEIIDNILSKKKSYRSIKINE